jgi:DNA-binding SARP family transcriptional activator
MHVVQAVVSILGPVRLLYDGQEQRLAGKLTRRLFARLVLAEGQALSNSELTETIWGQQATPEALRVQISRLRGLIEPSGLKIVTSARGWTLDTTTFVDQRRQVQKLLAELETESDPAAAVKRCTEILSLWTGQTLIDFHDEPWSQAEATKFDRIRENLRQLRSEALAISGAIPEALSELSAANREFPFDEKCSAWLAACLADAGRAAEALDVLHALRNRLAEELGLFPGDLPNQVENAILSNSADVIRSLPISGKLRYPSKAHRIPVIERSVFDHQLTGRDEAWKALISREPTVGSRVVLLSGEQGVGKSAIVSSYGQFRSARGALLLAGSFRELSNVPYEMFATALKSSTHVESASADFPGVAQLLSLPATDEDRTDARPEEIGAAFAAVIRSFTPKQPVVVLIEDIHLASESSLRALSALLGDFRSEGVGSFEFILTSASSSTQSQPLTPIASDVLIKFVHETIKLLPFERNEIALLLDKSGRDASNGMVDAIHSLTKGNPFLVNELLAHFDDVEVIQASKDGIESGRSTKDLPPLVARAIDASISHLSQTAKKVCSIVALQNAPVSFSTVSQVLGNLSQEEIYRSVDEAIDANLLAESSTSGDFSVKNPLYAYGILRLLTQRDRFVLHRQIADALLVQREANVFIPPGQVSDHLEKCGNLATISERATWLLQTSEHARLQGASDLAAQTSDRALTLLEQSSEKDLLLPAMRIRQLVAASVGDTAQSKALGAKLIAAALRSGDEEVAADALTSHCSYGRDQREDPDSLTLADLVIAQSGSASSRARSLAAKGYHLSMWLGASEEGSELAREAVVLAQGSGDVRAIGEAAFALGISQLGRPSLSLIQTAIETLRSNGLQSGRTTDVVRSWRLQGLISMQTGDMTSLGWAITELSKLGSEPGQWHALADVARWKSTIAHLEGRFPEAELFRNEQRMLGLGGAAFEGSALAQDALNRFCVHSLESSHPVFAALRSNRTAWISTSAIQTETDLRSLLPELPSPATVKRKLAETNEHLTFLVESLGDNFSNRNQVSDLVTLTTLSETVFDLGKQLPQYTEELFGRLLPYVGQFAVAGYGEMIYGSVDRYLGVLSSLLGDANQSEAFLRSAESSETSQGWSRAVAQTKSAKVRRALRLDVENTQLVFEESEAWSQLKTAD